TEALDRRSADLLRWEASRARRLEDATAGMEAPLRALRRDALERGLVPEGELEPTPCDGDADAHFAAHVRESEALVRALARLADADGKRMAAMLPARAPLDLAKNHYDVRTERILPAEIYVSSHAGTRADPITSRQERHKGLDISAPAGTPVVATADGTVVFAGSVDPDVDQLWSLLGSYVEIEHGATGFRTLYGHLSRLDVKAGQAVHAGDVIGAVGSTGHSTGPHLHYQVMKDGAAVNPLRYITDVVLVEDGDSIRYAKAAKR
ncbi:MAG TPA: M23 family metallopeptidase, partial [bacterium]|nr:M23 family metallopeptidase [bacterium]